MIVGSAKTKNTPKYTYLGVKITSLEESNEEIIARIGRASAATIKLNSVICKDRKRNKIRLYNTIFESIGTYGIEV